MSASSARLQTAPATMLAMAFDRDGVDQPPHPVLLPLPEPGPGQVLVRLEAAGVGRWDLLVGTGRLAPAAARASPLPRVAGVEGAGIVMATGPGGSDLHPGERVYGMHTRLAARHGCFAGYAVFDQGCAYPAPAWLAADQAAVLPVDGAIALRALRDVLQAQHGQRLVILGANGGIGHLALQLATRMGLRTLAIASGEDGVRLSLRLGADAAIDGRRAHIARAVTRFAGKRGALALLTCGGEAASQVAAAMPPGSRIAWPRGVEVPPTALDDVDAGGFGAGYDASLLRDLHALLLNGRVVPHVSRRFPLVRLGQALDAVRGHHLGRIATLMP